MTTQTGRPFNEWLRAQLKSKKMSQRQLAQASGVDHSTISRLVRGDRTPSLGTATKLARGLREIRDDTDAPQYLGLVSGGNDHEPDRPRGVRAPRGRRPRRGARAPGHGVLPRRPHAPLCAPSGVAERPAGIRVASRATGITALASVVGGRPLPIAGYSPGHPAFSPGGRRTAEPTTPAPGRTLPSGSQAQRTPAFWGAGVRAFTGRAVVDGDRPTGGGRESVHQDGL